jgi:hypothetical protein
MTHCIMVFASTHKVMKAEKLLHEAGIRHEIIPTPKYLSNDCGMSIRIWGNAAEVTEITKGLKNHNIPFKLHERETP